ncbi:MAG: EamA family transporter [Candidatus Magasanikbacteria bacterium]|nr:EamA family transporter [Candidatus Magasanikbacteria bacterium]
MWLLVGLCGYAVNSVVSILDKYVLDKAVGKPAVFTFLTCIPAALALLLVPWSGFLAMQTDYWVALLAGVAMVLGLWASYIGIQKSEISHIGPLIGATVPVFIFLWGRLFLGEYYQPVQIMAIIFLVCGSLFIAGEKSSAHQGFHSGIAWGILGGFLWSIFGASSKYLYVHNDFFSGFVWSQGIAGLVAMLLIFLPAVRRALKKSKNPAESVRGKKLTLVIVDKVLGVIGLTLVQYAVALGSATLVYALAGVQYAILVIAVALLSKFHSKLYRETYEKGELIQEVLAVIFIAGGLALLV